MDGGIMIKIRLARLGRKKRPFYRIVATNSRSPRDGKFLEILGTYDPLQEPSMVSIDNDKLNEWVKKGAQLSNRVQKLTDPEKYAELVKDKPKRKPKKAQPEESKPAETEQSSEEQTAIDSEASTAEESPTENKEVDTPEESVSSSDESTSSEDEEKPS
tara:strand:+ start:3057 stop:3533 length:477 start_codon:yes stop_codon:yes gene_type:complete